MALDVTIVNEFEGDLFERRLKLEEKYRETNIYNYEERDMDFLIEGALIKEIDKWIYKRKDSRESNFDSYKRHHYSIIAKISR